MCYFIYSHTLTNYKSSCANHLLSVIHLSEKSQLKVSFNTVEPRFNEVAGGRPNLFFKWRVRYIENLDIMTLRGNDQKACYMEVIVND